MSSIKSVCFCIPTNSSHIDKTILLLRSLSFLGNGIPEIEVQFRICGVVDDIPDSPGLTKIDSSDDATNGMLARLRDSSVPDNLPDVLVFVDDDFLFPPSWLSRLLEFSESHEWDILGNRILLPNGDRFWDRCTMNPHRMVDYSHPDADPNLYQTGGFWVMRGDIYPKLRWDPTLPINADQKGFACNEDTDISLRAHELGYSISFDPINLVWHNDESYHRVGDVILKLPVELKNIYGRLVSYTALVESLYK